MTEELSGRRIVVPETRELGQLVRMLEEFGADTVPCPMIAIRDAPDTAPVEAWLRRFADGTCDDLVLMTGEGLRRLLGFARRIGIEPAFIAALRLTRKITRGPKPVRALREIGLAADVPAKAGSNHRHADFQSWRFTLPKEKATAGRVPKKPFVPATRIAFVFPALTGRSFFYATLRPSTE